jgi:hypothetical protein
MKDTAVSRIKFKVLSIGKNRNMSSDDEDRYPTIQHTKQRDLVEDDDDDVDIDDDEQYEDDMGDNNGDVMDGDEDGNDDEGDQRITAWGTQKKRFYREGDEDEV